ncbi:MAG TPA: FAD:protein FMN transferase [Candidatus Limnocylindrales bacterium]|nr:FAD:protein FMN transferase [Candidatus Limnocylindrales bacterium]
MITTLDWRALGTGVRLVVERGDAASARAAVEGVLDRVDRAYSRFRPDSELMALAPATGAWRPVSPLLGDAIAAGLRAAQLSDGAVDLTVGRAMRAIGYDADFESIRTRGGPIELRLEPIPGWQTVELAPDRRSVRIRPGVEIDLGSVGKGLAADLAADAALGTVDPTGGVLVSLGGDIAVRGTAPRGGWRVLLAEDSDAPPDGSGDVVAIRIGAIATSSTTVRRWARGDLAVHHLIDPRTGGPVDSPWRTATVAAATCVEANTAATAAIVLGQRAVDWLERMAMPARLVAQDGSIVRIGGWPSPVSEADAATA